MPHRFKDEWILRAVSALPGIAPQAIEAWRAQGHPYLSLSILEAKLALPEDLGRAIAAASGLEWVSPEVEGIDKMALALVPEKVCRRYRLVPLQIKDDAIEVAMANPLDMDACADIQAVSGRKPVPFYCFPDKIEILIGDLHKPEAIVYDLLDRMEETASVQVLEGPSLDVEDDTPDSIRAPVIRLVNAMISKAVRMHASDLHLEHEDRSSRVRLRVDGALRTVMTLPRHIAVGPFVSRVKIMAALDIADHRRPQDGRAKIKVGDLELGLRVSTLPTNFGEKVVIRILDPRAAAMPFDKLGFHPDTAQRIKTQCNSAQGVILVTGPTGSGKTTTLYAVLNRLKSGDTNVITVEDPIEYKLEGINQVQVQEKQGLTFSAVLRSVLRQDPDVIMVGEVRDQETAEIAFQAALTGHLVLTTLHTNDTLASLTRLSDMGVERFKLAPGLLGITAQRLVRRLCAACRREVPAGEIDGELKAALQRHGLPERSWAHAGCPKCEFTGYVGRLLVIEYLNVDSHFRELITAGKAEAELRRAALESGALRSLLADSLWRVSQGDTTLEEVLPYIALAPDRDVKPAPAVSASAPAPAEEPEEKRGRRVLIADDDKAIRVILKSALERAGCLVEEASDGEAALEKIAGSSPDVLILDLDMPRLSGLEVVRGVRQGLGMMDLPIMILTASADAESRGQALALGADDYATKPFKPEVVVQRAQAVLARKAAGT